MQGDRTLLTAASAPAPGDPANDGRLTWTVTEVAKLLGISVATAYARVKSGAIPHLRLEGRILIPRKALLELLEAATAQPAPAGLVTAGDARG
jgi:excisionase family DNA binding protein